MLSFMRANASAANFGGQFPLHRSGSPHVLDYLYWPVLMTRSAESKVSSLLGSEALSKPFDIRRGPQPTVKAPVTFTLSWLRKSDL